MTVVIAAAIAVGTVASGSGTASVERTALVGEARQAKLTVELPAAYTDTIYGAPIARGRPIVVIDAGHGGRDPGARSIWGKSPKRNCRSR